MDELRIACVRYLNTVPLVEGLGKTAGVRVISAVPAEIAGLVAVGDADVGLASVIDAASCEVPLTMLPVGMIGCDGPTMTVRLYCRASPRLITRVFADVESHTSVALCRLLLEWRYGITPVFVAYDAARDAPECDTETSAMLLIGDKVVTRAPVRDDYPHHFDLGECWREITGLGFVYAAWMCREDRLDSPAVARAAMLLDRQRRRNAMRLAWISSSRAERHGWPVALADQYLGERIRYDVDEGACRAVDHFLAACHARGYAPRPAASWAHLPRA